MKWPIKFATSGRAIVFDKSGSRLLLVSANQNSWHFPGGMIDSIEPSAAACTRELYEETGIVAEISSFAAIIESIYDCRENFSNFLKVTDIYYHCIIEDKCSDILDLSWQDPDGGLIQHRKFFTQDEYIQLTKENNSYLSKLPFCNYDFAAIKEIQAIHFGYFNYTNFTQSQLQDLIQI
jgi:8-oxo-dGTP pyrophosphatase MutT (NUDIX family)